MLKTRVIGVVLVKDGIAVQSIGFRRYLPIGTPEIAIEYLDRWGIDEIAVLHMDATERSTSPSAAQVESYARQCQVPLTVGGGITQVHDVIRLIQSGADKVVINTAAVAQPEIISEAAALFGNQCVVVSIDARRRPGGGFEAFTHGGRKPTGRAPADLARQAEERGAGEILIHSIDQDGSQRGYDLDLLRSVVDVVSVPVIGSGGAGHPDHLARAMETGVAAVAAANFLHYTEHSVILIKHALRSARSPVRLDSYATYQEFALDAAGRPAKRDDDVLEELRFRYIPEEKI